MAAAVVIAVEGVLATTPERGQRFGAANRVAHGVRLLSALNTVYRTILVTCENDAREVEFWVKQQGLSEYVGLIVCRTAIEIDHDYAALRASQLAHLKGCGFNVELVIDTNPEVINEAMAKGLSGMLFAHPTYSRPEFRPDNTRGMRAWQAIVEEKERQNILAAGDVRLASLEHVESEEAQIEDEEDVVV